ncbi:tetratricopeptide repeat protein, partial [Escherichia coli]
EYELVLGKDPHYVKAMFNLGSLYAQLGNSNEAIMLLKRASELNPQEVIILNKLGEMYLFISNYSAAEQALKQSIASNPFQEDVQVSIIHAQYLQYCSNPE